MSTMFIVGNKVKAVYDDRLRPILEALGELHIERATDVEFEESSGDWVATHRATGVEIARGKNRTEVLQQEVRWLEEELRNESHSNR
jgi:hypothetical protein